MKAIYFLVCFVLLGFAASGEAKKIVLISGPLDDHAPGTHEYENNILLLKHCLENSPQREQVQVETHFGGWPKDASTLDNADTIVLTSGGSDRKETDHPLYVGDRFQQLEKQMERGCGLVMFHWSVFHPQRHQDQITEWLGGYFDYEKGSGGPTKTWFSEIQHATWPVIPKAGHPVSRGIKPFELNEEFYFNIRFRENDPRLTPILFKQASDRPENIIAWAVERSNGGRGFGFTGGHFFTNWWVPEFRKVVLNGIAWTAGLEVPSDGIAASLAEYQPPVSAKLSPAVSVTPAPAPKKIKPPTAQKDSGNVAKEEAWKDGRWNQMDIGNFMAATLKGGQALKGLAIRVGANNEGAVLYDTASASFRSSWLGGFLRFDPVRFGLIGAPESDGQVQFTAKPGWSGTPVTYRGMHLNGRRVVLSYDVGGIPVLESPWFETNETARAFVRTFSVGPGSAECRIALASPGASQAQIEATNGVRLVHYTDGNQTRAIAVTGEGVTFGRTEGSPASIDLHLQPSDKLRAFKVFLWSGASGELGSFIDLARESALEDLHALAKPGAPRWGEPIVTKGEVSMPSAEPYVVDTLAVPYENRFKALMFLSGVDFFSNGDAAVCTIHGDVWVVSGIDEKLQNVRWQRFATGLFQPLGLKVVDDKVYVLGRDQITILHDQNGDGEADFYENFCNRIKTSPGGHDYVTSLERDAAGNFYYVCPEGIHRVSSDGQQHETFATGFRNPNGLGVSPDGVITVAPQEGTWTPSSAICEIRKGGFYGYGGPQISSERPLGYDAPLCWIPRMIDNSTGSQVWVTNRNWGPLEGQMLNLSFGRCSMMLVLREVVDGQAQGGVVPLKPRFLSGAMRGTFRPQDGQLYVVGSHGWSTSATRDGCFQRVRYTGKKTYLPIGLKVQQDGISLTFTEPLDRETAEDPGSYGIEQWNYRYSQEYGSKEYSVASPSEEGLDELDIASAKLSPDGRSVFLEVAGLQPVMQMQIQYNVNALDGKTVRGEIYNTIHRLGARK